MRVFIFSWLHESHSFAAPTGIGAFEKGGAILRGRAVLDQLAGTNTEWGGVIDVAARHGWTLLPSIAASATPSGPVSDAAASALLDAVMADLEAAKPFGAVVAILHGAMQTVSREDAEGWILTRLREAVGPRIPIAVTLDPHANVTPAMVDAADLIVPYRTTPHVDKGDTGRRCGDLLAGLLARGGGTRHVWAQPAQNDLDDGRTTAADTPMSRLIARADGLAAGDDGIAAISLFGGFPWGDIATCGPSVLVTRWDGDVAAAERVARDFAATMWEWRAESTLRFHGLDEAMALLEARAPGPGPTILVDYADCPAGGSPGDNVDMLGQLIARGGQGFLYGIVTDPETAASAHRAGEGARIDVALGGKVLPGFSGSPLSVPAQVLRLTDGGYRRTGPVGTGSRGEMGPSALLEAAGNRIMVSSRPVAVEDLAQLRHFGIAPETERRMFLKAMNHFRADFDTIASHYIYVESPALCSHDWSLFDYRRIRRPVFPLDEFPADGEAPLFVHVSQARR